MNREIFLSKREEYRKLLIEDIKKRINNLLQYSRKDYIVDIDFSSDYEDCTSFKITSIAKFNGEYIFGVYNCNCNMKKVSIKIENLPTNILEYITSERIIGYGTEDFLYYKYNEEL